MPTMPEHGDTPRQTIHPTRMYAAHTASDTDGESKVNLLDLIAATDARDAAIARVATATDANWKAEVWAVIERFAAGVEFTTDTIWQACHDEGIGAPREPRALGAVMVEAARSGLVAATDRYVSSRRVACHARPIRVWVRR